MSTQNKEINHDFVIGETVFVLREDRIMRCLITGIDCNPNIAKQPFQNLNIYSELVDFSTKSYVLYEISYSDKDSFCIRNSCSKYIYHSSKVYANINDLLSDLRNTIEKSM